MAALLLVAVVALAAIALAASGDQRRLAFTTGVTPTDVAAVIRPGKQACQVPVVVSQPFSRLRFHTGTFMRPGPPLDVTVRSVSSDAVLARGRLAAGYPDGSQPIVAFDPPVPAGRRVAVCFRNLGNHRTALYGGGELAARDTTVVVDGKRRPRDLTLTFERATSRSALDLMPEMLDRASLFRPRWVGEWLFWALLVAVAAGVPALLALAVRAAGSSRG